VSEEARRTESIPVPNTVNNGDTWPYWEYSKGHSPRMIILSTLYIGSSPITVGGDWGVTRGNGGYCRYGGCVGSPIIVGKIESWAGTRSRSIVLGEGDNVPGGTAGRACRKDTEMTVGHVRNTTINCRAVSTKTGPSLNVVGGGSRETIVTISR